MPKRLRWLRSPRGSDGKPWKNWRRSRSRIRCWPGIESSSPTSSKDRDFANESVAHESTDPSYGVLRFKLGSIKDSKKSGFGPYATPPKRLRIFEFLVRDQEVGGSNPLAPTKISPLDSTSYAAFSTASFDSFSRTIRTTSVVLGGSSKPKPTFSACSKRNATSSFILQ